MKRVKRIFGIRNKILALMIITCFIPFICFSLFVYNNYYGHLEKTTVDNSLRDIEKSDKLLFSNMWLIEYATKHMCKDDEFVKMFTEGCSDAEYQEYIKNAISELSMVEGVTVFDRNNQKYEYGYSTGIKDKVNFILENGATSMSSERLTWSCGIDDLIMAGIILNDDKGTELARIFFLVSNEIFEGIYSDDTEKNTIVCDEWGNIIVSDGDLFAAGENIWNTSIELNNFIFNERENSIYTDFNGESHICVKYKSQFMGWYYVEIVKSEVFLENVRLITGVALTIGIITFILIFVIYLCMIRRLFKPISVIDNAMRNVVSDDFNIQLDIRTNDEFSIIAKGFNRMVTEIQKLLDDMKRSNEEKMRIEIEAMQYQVNPHFLYNVLATARFIALKNGQSEISDILLKLSRLFRMKLKDAEKDITVDEDISTMKDYVVLMNLRYDNKIDISFDIEDESRNAKLPGLVLQPIIENAITHGVAPKVQKGERGVVRISSKIEDDALVLSVYDNGEGMDSQKIQKILTGTDTGERIGFENVRKRLQYRYGDKHSIRINSREGEYTEVIITICK